MANYLQLKTRIRAEIIRDEIEDGESLETQFELHIARAIEFYADRKFWFNSIVSPGTTTANTATMTVPSDVRVIERVTIPAYDRDVKEVQLAELDDETVYALPCQYAYYNDTVKFYPIPDQAYAVNFYGIEQIAAPSADGDSSVWTNEAQDLICARTKVTLFRSQFRDYEAAQAAALEEREALERLLRETARRIDRPLYARAPSERFNIFTD